MIFFSDIIFCSKEKKKLKYSIDFNAMFFGFFFRMNNILEEVGLKLLKEVFAVNAVSISQGPQLYTFLHI